jgi:hypothetical protein
MDGSRGWRWNCGGEETVPLCFRCIRNGVNDLISRTRRLNGELDSSVIHVERASVRHHRPGSATTRQGNLWRHRHIELAGSGSAFMKVDPPLELGVVFPRTAGIPMHNLASAIYEQAHHRDDVLADPRGVHRRSLSLARSALRSSRGDRCPLLRAAPTAAQCSRSTPPKLAVSGLRRV